jgi:precorrin-8X/cobalt-precorrin-8 methylmutase
MELILLAGHGSPKQDANNLDHIASLLHEMIHPRCSENCVRVAYLQFARPDIMEAITACIQDGAKKVIVHPYFLSSGMHVTADIPGIIKQAGERYPGVEFVYTEALGVHNKMAQVVYERIHAAAGMKPEEIEKRSFEILSEEADLSDVPEERLPIVQRVIHATADFEFRNSLTFHPDAVRTGIEAIKAGKDILTDVEMVRTTEGTGNKTRAESGIEEAFKEYNNIGIIAIGNAPTALLKTIEILPNYINAYGHTPLLVGVPVGFVKALESKSLLAKQTFPYITNLSRKGGTPVAVSIVNALLKMADEK